MQYSIGWDDNNMEASYQLVLYSLWYNLHMLYKKQLITETVFYLEMFFIVSCYTINAVK